MVLLYNKKATFNYELLEDYEAGIVLLGSEVKSIRNKSVSIAEAFCSIRNNELFIKNMQIQPYTYTGQYAQHDITRIRKLLLKKKEILKIRTQMEQKRFSLIPIKLYLKKDLIKLSIFLCKSKKMFDKREHIKKKSIQREIQREMKEYRQ